MRITIMGANSYIARNLLYLVKQHEDIEYYLYDYQEHQIDGEAHYEQVNVLDVESLGKIHLDVDLVYIFIGKTGTSQGFDDYNTFIDINEKALLNLLKVYREQHSKAKLIFPSTRLVYEGKKGTLTEDAAKEFKTIYAINKFACEQYLKMYHDVYGVQYAIFRICVPYGTMITKATSYGTAEFMLKKAENHENITLYGGGIVRRTLIHMEDLCNILLLAGSSEMCINDIYNIGGEDMSLAEMADGIAKQYGISVESVPWPEMALKIESGDTVFDDSKLAKLTTYEFKHTFMKWIQEGKEE